MIYALLGEGLGLSAVIVWLALSRAALQKTLGDVRTGAAKKDQRIYELGGELAQAKTDAIREAAGGKMQASIIKECNDALDSTDDPVAVRHRLRELFQGTR